MTTRAAPPPSDPEQGIWQGRSVARRFVSPDGLTVLVGRSAADNDLLTFGLGESRDGWLHVAAESGSHVIVRNPDGSLKKALVKQSPSSAREPIVSRFAYRRSFGGVSGYVGVLAILSFVPTRSLWALRGLQIKQHSGLRNRA